MRVRDLKGGGLLDWSQLHIYLRRILPLLWVLEENRALGGGQMGSSFGMHSNSKRSLVPEVKRKTKLLRLTHP